MTVSNQFVSSFSTWASKTGYPLRVRRRLPRLLRQLPELLRDSDCRQVLVARTLDNDCGLHIRAEAPTHGVYSSSDKIVFYATGPSWDLCYLSKDEETRELVGSFLFCAGQYALRSRILRATSAVALSFGVLCDFRRASLSRVTFGPDSFVASLGDARKELETFLPVGRASGRPSKARSLKAWMARLNMMDPFVHRAVFQYWRALSLWKSDFGEDAITALDSLSAVAGDAIMTWTGSTAASRNFNPFIFEYIRLLIFVIADHISIVVAVHLRPAFAHERAVLLGTRDVIQHGKHENGCGSLTLVLAEWHAADARRVSHNPSVHAEPANHGR